MIRKFFSFIFRLLILALVIGIPGGWMIHRSYNDPEVHYFYTKEAEGEEALRFVVISDLYGYVFEGGNGVIADRASDTSPDAILIGGNMITADESDITPLTDLVKRLSQIAPVYYSYGEQELKYVKNHSGEDGKTDELREALTAAGAVVLNEEYADVSLYGIDTRIGGMYNNAYEMTGLDHKVKKRYESTYKFLTDYQNTDRFKIMLSSRPESFIYADACDTWKVDLVVSGNSLGGLVVLPHYGGVFGGSQGYFPEYINEKKKKGDVNLFITGFQEVQRQTEAVRQKRHRRRKESRNRKRSLKRRKRRRLRRRKLKRMRTSLRSRTTNNKDTKRARSRELDLDRTFLWRTNADASRSAD